MNNTHSKVIKIALIVIGIGILVFIASRVFPYLRGPYVKSINLEQEQLNDEYWYVIEGTVRNTESLSINTIKAPLSEDGSFTHPFALNPGRNEISISLNSGFGKTREYSYDIITPTLEELYAGLYNEAVESDTPQDEVTEPALATETDESVIIINE